MTDGVETIRDTPLGGCIGAIILDITADEAAEFLADNSKNRIYFHLSNGETIFATLAVDDQPSMVGLLGDEE